MGLTSPSALSDKQIGSEARNRQEVNATQPPDGVGVVPDVLLGRVTNYDLPASMAPRSNSPT
jgi:hypothetical protein